MSSRVAIRQPNAQWQWLPVAFWLMLIVLESTDMMSSQHTGSVLLSLLVPVFGPIDASTFDLFHHVLRKSGHFIGYGILSLLVFRALRSTVTPRLAYVAFWSVALTGVVASLDEWHQSYIPSRTGCLQDVVLDTAAAACVQLVLLGAMYVSRKRGGGSELAISEASGHGSQ
jgi:VanZ family protein